MLGSPDPGLADKAEPGLFPTNPRMPVKDRLLAASERSCRHQLRSRHLPTLGIRCLVLKHLFQRHPEDKGDAKGHLQ